MKAQQACVLAAMVAGASAFAPATSMRPVQSRAAGTNTRMLPMGTIAELSNIITAVADEADDLNYGSVAAPGWVLPVGALVVVATALIPILLKPGDDAARDMQQRDKDLWDKRD
ncbi:hypothetical protein JKP88DRAFT_223386 [Tribonema minus]|uniref:Uncharacterized protein n=1 Tax=Tribonema minus TaxID=303371 RepID=A0A835YTE3_9STRA|nr:hypothetical protein JKP88DRAFT_223386 [Tribonema minus]